VQHKRKHQYVQDFTNLFIINIDDRTIGETIIF